jgi:hypothetical protein
VLPLIGDGQRLFARAIPLQLGTAVSVVAGDTHKYSRGGGGVVRAADNYLRDCGGYEFNGQLKYVSVSLLKASPRQC